MSKSRVCICLFVLIIGLNLLSLNVLAEKRSKLITSIIAQESSKRLGVAPEPKRSLRYIAPSNTSKRLGLQQVGEAALEVRRINKPKPAVSGTEELVSKADKLFDDNEIEKAIELYRKVINNTDKISTNNNSKSDAYFGLATALIKLEKFDEAIEQINKGLQLSPNDTEAKINLGVALYRSGRVDDSIAHYKALLGSKSKDLEDIASIHYNLAVAYSHQGNFDEAIENYNKAIEKKKNYSEAYNNLGLIYEAKKDTIKAKECFLEAVKRKNNYPLAHYNLSRRYNLYDKEEYQKSIDELMIAIKQDPNFAEAYLELGNKYLIKKALLASPSDVVDVVDAVKVFQQALNIRKNNYPLAHENLAVALTLQKNFKDAYAHYRMALDQYQELSVNTLHNLIITRKKEDDFSVDKNFYIVSELSRAEDDSNLVKTPRETIIKYMEVEIERYEDLDDELKDNFTLRYCAGYAYFTLGKWNSSINEFAEAWELSGKQDKDALNALNAVLELVKYY
jgi:tetratricopeptide (TPR) repeat protein